MTHHPLNEQQLVDWIRSRIATHMATQPEQINIDEPLMSLGLDSLALLGMSGELAELLGKNVTADDLWDHDSIRLLSRHFAAGDSQNDTGGATTESRTVPASAYLSPAQRRPLARPLQPVGDRPPIFLVCGALGGLAWYNELTACLGEDRPVFGLTFPPGQLPTIEAMAAALADGMRTVQRRGPYHLVGFCFGGIVAYELACQMARAGEEVALLTLIDVPFPKWSSGEVRPRGVTAFGLKALTAWRSVSYVAREAWHDRSALAVRLRRQATLATHRWGRRFGTTDVTDVDAWASLLFPESERAGESIASMVRYRPGRFGGRILSLESREYRSFNAVGAWQWQRVTDGTFTRYPLAGSHNTVLFGNSAGNIAAHIHTALNQAADAPSGVTGPVSHVSDGPVEPVPPWEWWKAYQPGHAVTARAPL